MMEKRKKILIDKKTGKKYYEPTREDYEKVGLHPITWKSNVVMIIVLFIAVSPMITFLLTLISFNDAYFSGISAAIHFIIGIILVLLFMKEYNYFPTKTNIEKFRKLEEILEVMEV